MMFGWQRTRNGPTPLVPVVVYDLLHGCAKHEFVGGLNLLLKPEQQIMTLAELAAVYPAPELKPE